MRIQAAIDTSYRRLDADPRFQARRAERYRRLGRRDEARHAYVMALALAVRGDQRRYLARRLAELACLDEGERH